MLAQRRAPTSTSVIVEVRPECGRAAAARRSAAMPTTPTTIANIARCSRRPACSPSIRCATNSSTSRPDGERRLHDDERREQQRDELQRPAEDRQPGAEQPARAPHEPLREREPQVLLVRAPPWRPSPGARPLGCTASRRRRPPRCQARDRPCPPTIIAARLPRLRARGRARRRWRARRLHAPRRSPARCRRCAPARRRGPHARAGAATR